MNRIVSLSDAEWAALDAFLEELENYQSSAGCNDLQPCIAQLFENEEGKLMAENFSKLNSPGNPEGPDWPLPDFCLVSLLRHKIKKQL